MPAGGPGSVPRDSHRAADAGCRSPNLFPTKPVDPEDSNSWPRSKDDGDVALAITGIRANDNKLVTIVLQHVIAHGCALTRADVTATLEATDARAHGSGAYGASMGSGFSTYTVLAAMFDVGLQLEVLGTPASTAEDYVRSVRGFDVSSALLSVLQC